MVSGARDRSKAELSAGDLFCQAFIVKCFKSSVPFLVVEMSLLACFVEVA